MLIIQFYFQCTQMVMNIFSSNGGLRIAPNRTEETLIKLEE